MCIDMNNIYLTACLFSSRCLYFYLCAFLTAGLYVDNVSASTHFVSFSVYTAGFQLSEWIRLNERTNATVIVTHMHTQKGRGYFTIIDSVCEH